MQDNIVKKVLDLYAKKSFLSEREYASNKNNSIGGSEIKKQVTKNQQKIDEMLPDFADRILEDFDSVVEELNEILKEDNGYYSSLFNQPIVDEFLNQILYDIKIKNILDDEQLEKLKEELSKKGIEIYSF